MPMMKIKNIKPYPGNPRKNDAAVEAVARSIEAFGFRAPIIVDKDHVIIAGHTRYKAARLLELEKVPVVVARDLTPAQVKAYRIADNKTGEKSEWDVGLLKVEIEELKPLDIDIELTGFDFDEIEILTFEEDTSGKKDRVPSTPTTPICKKNDQWTLGPHMLICGDSTDAECIASLMGKDRADMVFTDPPYGVSYADKNKYLNSIDRGNRNQTEIENDHLSESELKKMLINAFGNIRRYLSEYGVYYITAPQGGGEPIYNDDGDGESGHPASAHDNLGEKQPCAVAGRLYVSP